MCHKQLWWYGPGDGDSVGISVGSEYVYYQVMWHEKKANGYYNILATFCRVVGRFVCRNGGWNLGRQCGWHWIIKTQRSGKYCLYEKLQKYIIYHVLDLLKVLRLVIQLDFLLVLCMWCYVNNNVIWYIVYMNICYIPSVVVDVGFSVGFDVGAK